MFNVRDKVSKIEFHMTYNQLNDFILRAAELIKEGYSIEKIETDTVSIGDKIKLEPAVHITLQKKEDK